MTCFHPLRAYRSKQFNPETGKYGITFNPLQARAEALSTYVPCGQCIGCRLHVSQQWALRCSHEAKMHDHNSFVTLTFDDKHLPASGSVTLSDVQQFMWRLRKWNRHHNDDRRIKFFACGEYGENLLRPHYHALLFGQLFPDQKIWQTKKSGTLYRSNILEKLWPFGFSTIGRVNYKTAAYTARYAMKKVTGEMADDHYLRPHPLTGELARVETEFITMSKNPGLGSSWFDRFKADCYPSDYLIVDGRKHPIPRYYDNKLASEHLSILKIARKRKIHRPQAVANTTPERLKVREKVTMARVSRLVREMEPYHGASI